jgi:predicted DNA-binding transcriptional regulator AlpA
VDSQHLDADVLEGWMTRAQAAAALRVTADTLYRWQRQGIGPRCGKIGGRVYYRAADVEEWLLARMADDRAAGGAR